MTLQPPCTIPATIVGFVGDFDGAFFVLTALAYAAASILYILRLMQGEEGAGRFARRTLIAALCAHALYLVSDQLAATITMPGIHRTLTYLSLGVVVVFLLATFRRPTIGVLGAFLAPTTLVFFLGSGLGRSVAEVPPGVRSALLPIHVSVNLLGIVSFALAFAAAVAYVMQERMLRRKQLGGIFQRLPPLDVLDGFGFRFVRIGFPLLTLGIVTGAFWTLRLGQGAETLSATHLFAIVAWVIFAAVLTLRVAAGWRGYRAAIGTILGFLSSTAVLAGYLLRGAL